jgi:stage V sporulation protein K
MDQIKNEERLWAFCEQISAQIAAVSFDTDGDLNAVPPRRTNSIRAHIAEISGALEIKTEDLESALEEAAITEMLTSLEPNPEQMLRSDLRKHIRDDSDEPALKLDIFSLLQRLVSLGSQESNRQAFTLAEDFIDVLIATAPSAGLDPEHVDNALDGIKMKVRRALGEESDGLPSRTLEEFDKAFEPLVGLTTLKTQLREFIQALSVELQTNSGIGPQSLHMAFLGDPGTGKTEVARTLGSVLKAMCLLTSGHFTEVSRKDLVGTHIGESEDRLLKILDKADGGILFIDEAYSLQTDDDRSSRDFGQRVIDILVPELENRRNRLMVIFAGYELEMDSFLKSNPGLKSRVPQTLHFANYSAEELLEIAERSFRDRQLGLDSDARERLSYILTEFAGNAMFGNARGVRNIVEAASRRRLAVIGNLGNLATSQDRKWITSSDIVVPELDPPRRRIGF